MLLVSSAVLRKLFVAIDEELITDEILDVFINDPQNVLRQYPIARERARQVGLLPKGNVYALSLSGDTPYFILSSPEGGRNVLYAGKESIAEHRGIAYKILFADGLPLYLYCEDHQPGWRLACGNKKLGIVSDQQHLPWFVVSPQARPLYVACLGGQWTIVHGTDILAQEKEPISHVTMTQDGTLSYVVGNPKGGKCQRLIVCGAQGNRINTFGPYSNVDFTYAPLNGLPLVVEHLIRSERFAGHRIVHSDDNEIAIWHDVRQVFVDPKTGRVVCLGTILKGGQSIACMMRVMGQIEEFPEYSSLTSASIVNGDLLVVADKRNAGDCVVWNGEEEESFSFIVDGSLSLACGHPLYIVKRAEKFFVVWARKEGAIYDEIFSLHVEGDMIVYGARKGRKIFRVERPMTL